MQLSLLSALGLEVLLREGRSPEDSRQAIHQTTQALLPEQPPGRVVAILLMAHPSITAAFPAEGARLAGWTNTPLLCLQAPDLPSRTIRVVSLCADPSEGWVGIRGANHQAKNRSVKRISSELCNILQQQNPGLPFGTKYILTTVTSDIKPFSIASVLQDLRWEPCLLEYGLELNVPSLPKVVRMLVLARGLVGAARHVFLHETAQLRPDLGPSLEET